MSTICARRLKDELSDRRERRLVEGLAARACDGRLGHEPVLADDDVELDGDLGQVLFFALGVVRLDEADALRRRDEGLFLAFALRGAALAMRRAGEHQQDQQGTG